MGRPSENKETHCYRGMPSVQLVAIQPVQPSHTSQIVDSAQHFNFWNPFLCKNKNENKNTPLNLRIYFVVILIVNSGPTGSYSNCAFLVYTARITFPNSGMSHPIFQKITLRQYFKVGDYRHQSAGTLGNCCHQIGHQIADTRPQSLLFLIIMIMTILFTIMIPSPPPPPPPPHHHYHHHHYNPPDGRN